MAPVPDTLHPRRIGLFLLVAFGFSWLVGAYVSATGGLAGGTVRASTLTGLLVVYMFGPALGHLVVRTVTDAEWSLDAAWLRPHLRKGLRWYVVAWLFPAVTTLTGVALYYALFPQHFDLAMEGVRTTLGTEIGSAVSPATIAVVQLVVALTLGPAINTFVAFGEEFGWRGFLLQHLLPLGTRQAVVLTGVVWGVWHWPVIAMGYNYGFDYPGAPWAGMLAMVWVTVFLGSVLAWVTLRSGSVWPAALGHGAFNAIAGYGVLFVAGDPSPLLGPFSTGLVVSIPLVVLGGWLLWKPDSFDASGVPEASLT
ncbi:CPBP family intramembrane glutamic endopeptidase [Halobacteriaceae archaeon GCM10025711]